MKVRYKLTKRPLALLLALVLVVSLLPVNAFAATGAEGHWAQNAIETCHTYGIMNGDGNGAYRPDDDITRAEFAAMVNRAFGYDALTVPELSGYTDVPADKWYAGDMSTAIALGIIEGYGNGTVAPEDKITREQAAVILVKIMRMTPVADDTPTHFTDIDSTSDWARSAVLTMEQSGYVVGCNNQFLPTKNLTRGEAAQMLVNVFGVILDENLDAEGKTYGNVTIRKPGIVLKNAVVKGDLFIAEGVADGDVWLDTVQIGGRLLAAGGGENSIHVNNITVGDNVVVDKPSVAGVEPVRFRAVQTGGSTVVFQGTAREVIITEDIIIIIDNDGEKTVFNMFASESKDAKPSVLISGDAVVEKITAFVPTEIKGGGDVGKVEAHSDGVTVDAGVKVAPGNVEAEKGVEVKVGGETVTGTGITEPTPKPSDPVTPPSDPTPTPTPEATPDPTPTPTTPPSTGGGNTGGGTTTQYWTTTFNGNGSTGGTVPAAISVVRGNGTTLPGNTGTLTKTGYTFGGWATTTGTASGITGTYTPTANTTLYAVWTAVAPATTPTASFDAETMILSDVTTQMEYSLDGGATWMAIGGTTATINAANVGITHGIKIRDKGDGSTTGVSATQTITLTQATSPSGADATDQTAAGANDGTITNVSTSMEYRLLPSGAWTACGGTTVSNLAPGSYEVRVKGAGAVLASAAVIVTVKAKLGGMVSITGTIQPGQTLTANVNGITPTGATLSYQWQVGGGNVGTNSTYVIQTADAGKTITVTVTGTGSYTGSVTSTATTAVPYTIKLTVSGNTGTDAVSFNTPANTNILETTALSGSVTIYYTLENANANNRLVFSGVTVAPATINTAGSGSASYTLSAADASSGVITVVAAFEHSNDTILDAPTGVTFDKTGAISFGAGANNAAASATYTYTLYNGSTAVTGYVDQAITSGGATISALATEMLKADGAYTVKVKANSTAAGYATASAEAASGAVNVYKVDVTLSGVSGDTVNSKTSSFIEYHFGGDTVTLTATPGANRKVTWSGSGSGSGNVCTITAIAANEAVTAAFSAKTAQTIAKSTYDKTTPIVGELITSSDGTYTANDGGAATTHAYQWKRSDSGDRTGNVANLATTQNYTPVTADYGKYIWLETTPVGDGTLAGTAVQGDVLQVGVKLITAVSGAGGGSATVNGTAAAIVYGQANIVVSKNTATDTVAWSDGAAGGTFGSTTAASTTYTPNGASGTVTLAATLTAALGTASNPFLVANETDLRKVGTGDAHTGGNWTLSAHYKQTANITLSNTNFAPIGNNSTTSNASRFTGSYDGSGKTISGLIINVSAAYQGLFGYIGSGGVVKNVGIIGVNISVGGNHNDVGAVAGYNSGTVENCYATGSVSGYNYVGGVAGRNSGGTVQNCYATVSVNGFDAVGGVVGGNYSSSTVQNCYATGSISGTGGNSAVGGVVGFNSSGTVQTCIALNSSVTATASSTTIGRVVGGNNSTLNNNYAWSGMTLKYNTSTDKTAWDKGTGNNIDGADITAAEAKTDTTWTTAGFTFTPTSDAVWTWNNSYMPALHGEQIAWPLYLVDSDGSAAHPFLIYNESDLLKISKNTAGTAGDGQWTLEKHYEQMASFSLAANWTAIGDYSEETQFVGTYDGGGHTITGLNITAGSSNYQGLFGYIGSGGVVKNLGLVNVNITGAHNTGGFVGSNDGKIENCYATGTVQGNECVGGVVGYSASTVSNCYFIGTVSGVKSIGGVAGLNGANGTVKNCYATGSVSGSNTDVGGMVGTNHSTVENCFAASTVQSSNSTVGGMVGHNQNNGTVQNCVALNVSVTATNSTADIGRVAGANSNTGTPFSNNYAWSGMTVKYNTSGTATDKTLVTGANAVDGADITAANAKTDTTWTTSTNWNTTTGSAWDFTDTWTWDNNYMPSLHGEEIAWPGHLSDPGTVGNPFLVTSEADLRGVGTDSGSYTGWTLSAHYKQTANITLTGGNWTPIGSSSTNFTGSYDGGGHTISGLTISASTAYQGLFGCISSVGAVKNLGLLNVNITGNGNVGGVVGYNGGTIQNCYVTGTIIGTASTIGGVAGHNYGKVQNCYAAATVSGTFYVGGVVGHNDSTGTVQNCVALNQSVTRVSGTQPSFGRVVGNNNSSATLTNNYAWSGMVYIDVSTQQAAFPSPANTTSGKDGADITAAEAKTDTTWTTSSNWNTTTGSAWDFTDIWVWDSTSANAPSLKDVGTAQTWPVYLVDAGSTSLPLSFTLAAVTVNIDGSGTTEIIGVEDGYTFIGETVTVTAMPDEGWTFSHWEDENGEIVSYDAEYTFIVTGDVTLAAVFTEDAAQPVGAQGGSELQSTDPRKESDPIIVPDNDDESDDPDGDGGNDNDGNDGGMMPDGGTDGGDGGRMSPQEAITTLNNLLNMCSTARG